MKNLPKPLRDRIELDESGCWIWVGTPHPAGYGQFHGTLAKTAGSTLAHRIVWSCLGRKLPEHLHHECHVRKCVNPDHLKPLTSAEHQREHNFLVDACKRGHPWTPENTYIRTNGQRQCRACKARRMRDAHRADPVRFNEARRLRKNRI